MELFTIKQSESIHFSLQTVIKQLELTMSKYFDSAINCIQPVCLSPINEVLKQTYSNEFICWLDWEGINILTDKTTYLIKFESAIEVYNRLKKVLPKYKNSFEFVATNQLPTDAKLEIVITKESLKQINEAKKYVAKDDLRPVMNNVYIDNENIVGTDSHCLYCQPYKADDLTNAKPTSLHLSPEMIKELKADMYIFTDNQKLYLCNMKKQIIKKFDVLGVKYPNYKSVMPYNEIEVKLDSKELKESIKIVMKSANQASRRIDLHFNNGRLEIKGYDLDFSTESKCYMNTTKGVHGYISFKAQFLLKCLGRDKETVIKLPYSNERATYINEVLIMPMGNDNIDCTQITTLKDLQYA